MTDTRGPPWRRLPPAHSPVHLPAVMRAATRAALRRDADDEARAVARRIRRRFGARRVLLTTSGTGALTLALRAARSRTGSDRVALPAWACYDVATAAAGAGSRALLYDLDPTTLGPDRGSLEAALRRGVGAVVVVHAYGYPVDVPALRELTDRHGALLVEDAAQGAGGSLDGRPLGSHGELAVLSFGRGKGRSAGGGGALLAGSGRAADMLEAAADELRSRRRRRGAREVGVALAQWALGRPTLYGIPASLPFLGLGETTYRPPRPPEPMAAAAAGVLLRTPDALEREEGERRRKNARRYRDLLRGTGGIQVVEPIEEGRPGELRLPVLLPRPAKGCPPLGVMPGYPKLLGELKPFRPFLEGGGADFPGAARLRDRLLTLPTHSRLRSRDLDQVVTWLRDHSGPTRTASE